MNTKTPQLEEVSTAYQNKRVCCPNCGESIGVKVTYHMEAVDLTRSGDHSTTSARDYFLSTLDESDRAAVNAATENGLIEPFAKAFEAAQGMKPKIAEKALMSWLRIAQAKSIPSDTMRYLASQYPAGTSVQLVTANRLGGLLVNGAIEQFFPVQLLDGDSVRGKAGAIRVGATNTSQFEAWIRTKYGYVANRGAMWESLNRKSYGAFARPMIESATQS